MIAVRNLGEERIELQKLGSAAVANDIDNFIVPYNGYIKAIYAVFGVMGTDGTGAPTQNVLADLKKNGTSIFSAATKITWSHALQLGTANKSIAADVYSARTTEPTPVSKGDLIRLDITQILNGTAPVQPQDLMVHVVFTRGSNSAPSGTLAGQVTVYD